MKDIYQVVGKEENWFNETRLAQFNTSLSKALNPEPKVPRLRLSQMGARCPCALWHSIHRPLEQEPLPPWARIKFTYGHILEALVIELAKAAGHEVTGEQDAVSVDGIIGHRDCVIDGCIVDVKSAASRTFQKFKDGTIASQDSFGYLDQLDGYVVGSVDDPLVRTKDRGYNLVVDKTLGHLCLYEHVIREQSIRNRIKSYKEIVDRPTAPECSCETVPEGKSGNIKLDVTASYNSFKWSCKPGLRCFLYANGPVYLTHVKRKPDVPEINREGKTIYG